MKYNRDLCKPSSLWKHEKSGKIYIVRFIALDASNCRDGSTEMVVYSRSDDKIYTRVVEEFLDGRFTPLNADGTPVKFNIDY